MFRQDTTIVVGAGASCEIGLPSGDQLKNQILKLFEPSEDNAYGLKNETLISIVKTRLSALGQDFHYQSHEFQKERSSIRDAAARIFRGLPLGSGLVDHSQKMTVAARATAAKKAVGQRS